MMAEIILEQNLKIIYFKKEKIPLNNNIYLNRIFKNWFRQ